MSKKIPIFIGFVLLILTLYFQINKHGFLEHYTDRLQELAYDVQLKTRLFRAPHHFKTSVAIIDIDDKSLDRIGRWPWPRSKLAELVTHLQANGAVVIAFDMIFPEKEENIAETVLNSFKKNQLITPEITPAFEKIIPYFDTDSQFGNTFTHIDTVLGDSFLPRDMKIGLLIPPVLTLNSPQEKALTFITARGYIGNNPVLQATAKSAGFINVFGDEDGIIRSVPLFIRYQDGLYPSLALEAVRTFLLTDVHLITEPYNKQLEIEGVKIADHVIPTDGNARVIIPFRGKSYTFPYYSAIDVLENKIPNDSLEGKIVFIGTSATGLGDLQTTAIQPAFPGVEIEATVADGILTGNFPYRPAWGFGAEISITVVLGLLFVFVFPYLSPWLLTFMMVAVPLLLITGNNWLWETTGLIISILFPIILTLLLALINIVYGYLFESRRREHLKEMFGQYVPAKHIDEMLTSKSSYGLYGEDREMTVLFADIRNFTTISENMSASQIKEMLNNFLTPMTEIIFKHRGTIDKYVGDMIMAFWGAPLKDKRHAKHAISAAIEMQQALKKLRETAIEKGSPEIRMGIGLNSGLMSVGDMGSKFRRNYTVLGDAVNLASRIENLTKFYGVSSIATEFTVEQQPTFVFRLLDKVRVKGKDNAVKLFEIVGFREQLTPELAEEIQMSETALNYYFNSAWQNAYELFLKLSEKNPESKFYKIYLARIAEFEKNPPSKEWDGIYSHIEK